MERVRRSVSLFGLVLYYTSGILFVMLPQILKSESREGLYLWIVQTLTMVLYGTLGIIAVSVRGGDERIGLFAITGVVVSASLMFDAVELRLPRSPLQVVQHVVNSALAMAHVPIIVHMSAVIPRRHEFVARHRLFLPALYGTFLTLAAVRFAFVAFAAFPILDSPWTIAQVNDRALRLDLICFTAAGLTGLALLGSAAKADREVSGRRQALLLLVPLAFYTAHFAAWLLFGDAYYETAIATIFEPFVALLFATSFFFSVIRYRLFDLGVVIRRGLIFGTTSGLLAAGIYALVAGGAMLARRIFDVDEITIWALAIVFLIAGAVFQPVYRRVSRAIDTRFFHEKLELEALEASIIPELAACSTVEDAASHLVRRVRESLNLESVHLLVADPSHQFFRTLSSATEGGARAPAVVLSAEELEPWTGALRTDLPFIPPASESDPFGRAMGVLGATQVAPVRFQDRVIGLLVLGRSRSDGELDGTDLERIRSVSRQASAMLENMRLRDLATIDPLTRLPRRQVATEQLEAEVARAQRSFHPFAVAMADIDFFKKVNDTYGHLAGDAVLTAVARELSSHSRKVDLVARYGGEEFLFLLPETRREDALSHLERLRQRVGEVVIGTEGGPLQVTISIGVRVVDDPSALAEPEALVRDADKALYEAKRNGRNQVVSAAAVSAGLGSGGLTGS